MKLLKIFLIVVIVFAAMGAVSFIFKICPPSGPWPAPPWCEGGQTKRANKTAVTDFEISKPQYPGSRGSFAFPPSCALLPDAIAKSVCEDYKAGAMIFWQEPMCDTLPFASSKKMCKKERAELKKFGDKKIAGLRKSNPEWWKRPDLNVYVYGDTRLRTEELRPDVSVWGNGSFNGWRDDEIFMTHAAGIFKIVNHSFVVINTDLDYMRDDLIKKAGITIITEKDLKNPEVVKIKNDLEYLKSKSLIFQKIIPAINKNFDNTDVITDYTFPDGKKVLVNVSMSAIVPAFKDYLIQFYKWQVDAGADGMFVDGMAGHNPATSFNAIALKKFGEWLANNADKTTLAKYNITDTANFNYQEFLKRAGYTRTTIDNTVGPTIGATEAWRSIPLMLEFRRFLIEENQKALVDIVTEVKAYARAKGRTDFIATGNAGELASSGAFMTPYFDYLTFEHEYLLKDNPLSYGTVLPVTSLAEAKERPVANQILVGNWDPLAHKTSRPLRMDIMKLAVMESYAGGSATYYARYAVNDPRAKSHDRTTIYQAMEDRFDLIEIQKAFGFMRHYKEYFKNFNHSTAKVAVIYDNDEVIREWKEAITGNHQASVEDIAENLLAAGIAYDVINWKQLDERVKSKQYQFVILPKFKSVGGDFSTVLQKAKDAGAKIISMGETPQELSRFSYLSSSENTISSALKGAVAVLRLPTKMKAVIKKDDKGNFLVHLLNYNYNAAGFKEQKNIAIDMAFFGKAKKITFASLENPKLIELDADKPVAPGVTTYGMLIIEK